MFKGSIVALITPFKNGKLDEESYANLIHHHISSGTNGIVPAGTTGESPTLSHHEHRKVIEISVSEAKNNPIDSVKFFVNGQQITSSEKTFIEVNTSEFGVGKHAISTLVYFPEGNKKVNDFFRASELFAPALTHE